FAALGTLAWNANAQSDRSLVDLRVQGLGAASPLLNSILGVEIGGGAIDAEVDKARGALAAEPARVARRLG
ncbi:MAG: hypothetical protein ACREBE_26755, partial [bacterium]